MVGVVFPGDQGLGIFHVVPVECTLESQHGGTLYQHSSGWRNDAARGLSPEPFAGLEHPPTKLSAFT